MGSLKDLLNVLKKDLAGIPAGKKPQPSSLALIFAAILTLLALLSLTISSSPASKSRPDARPKID